MRWWCSAGGGAWSWEWQPYPGVWLFVAGLAAAGWWMRRSADRSRAGRDAAWVAGLLLTWAALDWPLGPLGAGYLASVHMLQYLLIGLVVPALLLLGVPDAAWRALAARARIVGALRISTHPLVALAVFQAALVWTHLPAVVDGWMASQAGSFALDMIWFAAGLWFWWPVLAAVPERPRFRYPLRMGYLFLATVVNTLPYAFLTFGELPFYGTYELAPRAVEGLSARQDQQIAGLLMKVGGGAVLWTAITILFFRWYRREGEPDGPVPRDAALPGRSA